MSRSRSCARSLPLDERGQCRCPRAQVLVERAVEIRWPRARRRRGPTAARTIAIATAKKSVNRMRIGIRLMRPSAGSRPRARSRATPRRTAGRPSRAGSGRRRRSRSSGSRTRSPRRARSAAAGSASARPAHERLEQRELLRRERDLVFRRARRAATAGSSRRSPTTSSVGRSTPSAA